MILIVADTVHTYNTKRPHWSCYMRAPEQMHAQSEIEIRMYKKPNSSKDSPATV
jgi:transposase InsO family protein